MTEGQGISYGATERCRAEREATEWLILLQEEPDDPVVRESFQRWRDAGAVHAEVWAETLQVSARIAAIPPAHAKLRRASSVVDSGDVVAPLVRAVARDYRVPTGRKLYRAGSFLAAAAAVVLSVLAGPDMLVRFRADAISGSGEVRVLHLADGTTVSMAPRSALAVDAKSGAREVRVLRGSAYFDVAHDPAHPFRVLSDDTVTTVLGTAFEVQRHHADAGTSVSVGRGRVAVTCAGQIEGREVLAVGDAVDMSCGGNRTMRRKADIARVATWRQGQIVVSDRPVREVVDALRPWHQGFIIATGERLDTDRVTGVYDARNPDRALRGLSAAHALTVRHLTPWITVVTAD